MIESLSSIQEVLDLNLTKEREGVAGERGRKTGGREGKIDTQTHRHNTHTHKGYTCKGSFQAPTDSKEPEATFFPETSVSVKT